MLSQLLALCPQSRSLIATKCSSNSLLLSILKRLPSATEAMPTSMSEALRSSPSTCCTQMHSGKVNRAIVSLCCARKKAPHAKRDIGTIGRCWSAQDGQKQPT